MSEAVSQVMSKLLSLLLIAIVVASAAAPQASAHSLGQTAAPEKAPATCHGTRMPTSIGHAAQTTQQSSVPDPPINYRCCLVGHDKAVVQGFPLDTPPAECLNVPIPERFAFASRAQARPNSVD